MRNIKKTRKSLFRHAKRRAKERYNLDLTNEDLNNLTALIQNNKAKFIKKKSLNRSTFSINYKGEELKIVYDRARHAVVTCLPYPTDSKGEKKVLTSS